MSNALQEGLKRAATSKTAKAQPQKPAGKPQGSRVGTVLIAGHFDPSVKQRLLRIRAEHPARTQQDLLTEALNYLFDRYKQPRIER